MTPLVKKLASVIPRPNRFMWFDLGSAGTIENISPALINELITHMPFESISICATDFSGGSMAILLQSRNIVEVAGIGFLPNTGKLCIVDPFEIRCQGEGIQTYAVPNFPLPSAEQRKAMLAVISNFARSLSEPAEAYRATPAKTIMNRARLKKGKPGLTYEWHTVQVAPAAPKPEPKGGTHASPKLHDRRGHWRTRNGRKHWVRACVVGDPDKGVVEKDYRVGHVRKAN